jgi:P-type E1-E2 ATPase
MAMIIAFTVSSSAVVVSYFHYRNLNNLYQITHIEGQSQVLRNGEWTLVDQKNLLPGDLVKLASGVTYCDMIVLGGDYVLVDESALTGEATPQVKLAVNDASDPNIKYRPYIHKRHTVSAGTSILEAEEATALVMKTASYTAKGELLREIFAFRRHSFKFDTEVYIVLAILCLIAIVGFTFVIIVMKDDGAVAGWFYAMVSKPLSAQVQKRLAVFLISTMMRTNNFLFTCCRIFYPVRCCNRHSTASAYNVYRIRGCLGCSPGQQEDCLFQLGEYFGCWQSHQSLL